MTQVITRQMNSATRKFELYSKRTECLIGQGASRGYSMTNHFMPPMIGNPVKSNIAKLPPPPPGVRVHGKIIQATDDGLLVESHESSSEPASYMKSTGGAVGETIYRKPNPNDIGRPQEITGTFWIVGHPNQLTKVDGESIDVDVLEDGVFSYTAVSGAATRVKKYKVLKTYRVTYPLSDIMRW